jgi:hypothetical protein
MFCAPGHIFGGIVAVGSRFHVLHSRTRFRRYRGRWVPFSCFALPDSFSTLVRTLGPVSIFCAPGHVFGCTEGVGARFIVLRSRTIFGRYRGRRGSFSSFALPNTFLAVPRALGPVFKFCLPGLVFDGTACQVSFSYFALPDSF